MALTVKQVPDAIWNIGPSLWKVICTLAPGSSDYPSLGYVLGSGGVAVPGIKNFFGAAILGVNAATITAGMLPTIVVAETSGPVASLTSIKVPVLQVNTTSGLFEEVSAGTDLSGDIWTAVVYGY